MSRMGIVALRYGQIVGGDAESYVDPLPPAPVTMVDPLPPAPVTMVDPLPPAPFTASRN